MITFYDGKLKPIPLRKIIDPATKRTRVRYVDTKADPFLVGRKYMIRLEKEDFTGKNLAGLAKAGEMDASEFRQKFSYLVK
jgi:6-phosphofructokinase 1